MSNLALMEVQRALYTKLHGDAVLMGMVTGVYDVVPQASNVPYLRIGDGDCRTLAAEAVNLSELVLELDVWATATGRKTVLTILNRLVALLHLGTMTLSGYQLVLLHCEQAATEINTQGEFVHGTMQLRVTVAEA